MRDTALNAGPCHDCSAMANFREVILDAQNCASHVLSRMPQGKPAERLPLKADMIQRVFRGDVAIAQHPACRVVRAEMHADRDQTFSRRRAHRGHPSRKCKLRLHVPRHELQFDPPEPPERWHAESLPIDIRERLMPQTLNARRGLPDPGGIGKRHPQAMNAIAADRPLILL